jgi:hypothetical protein
MRAANEVTLHVIKLILYFAFGLITGKVIAIGMAIALAGLLSSLFMRGGLKWISAGFFRNVGYASMVISGAAMLAQSTGKLFAENKAYFYILTGRKRY